MLDVDVRVGDYGVDNTHKLRGGAAGSDMSDLLSSSAEMPIEDDPDAIRQTLWLTTDGAFKAAAKKYQRVLTDLKTKVAEDDKSGDFTREKPSTYTEPEVGLQLDAAKWAETVGNVSRLAGKYPQIYSSRVALVATVENRCMVTSGGTRLQTARKLIRVAVIAASTAEDGMELSQSFIFDAAAEDKLPSEEQIAGAFKKVMEQVIALRAAPLVEPYTGPAILKNRASGVFFHEIFGHRIEGHRQKDVEEGQTFAKKIRRGGAARVHQRARQPHAGRLRRAELARLLQIRRRGRGRQRREAGGERHPQDIPDVALAAGQVPAIQRARATRAGAGGGFAAGQSHRRGGQDGQLRQAAAATHRGMQEAGQALRAAVR